MKLMDKLVQETILVPWQTANKECAIQELLTHLQSQDILSATVHLFTNLKEREKTFTSSSGSGISYPHSTSIEVNNLTYVLGISHKCIDINYPDGHDCHLILLTISPVDDSKRHRKFITRFQTMV